MVTALEEKSHFNEHVGPKILAKIKIYVLTRAELLFQVCYEIPCSTVLQYYNSFFGFASGNRTLIDLFCLVRAER